MPSSADPFGAALEGTAQRILDAVEARANDAPAAVLIDGRSGSGKTTLAALLRRRWVGGPDGVQLVALDDIYPGWDGLAAGADLARAAILEPFAGGRTARWRRWDWETSSPGTVEESRPGVPLIIEGCGVLTAASAAFAPVRVWLDSPVERRRERALARDGDTYRPHWDSWAAQEAAHIRDHDPLSLATLVVEVP